MQWRQRSWVSWGIHFPNTEELASVGRVRQEEDRKGTLRVFAGGADTGVMRVLATEGRGDPGERLFKEMARISFKTECPIKLWAFYS